MPPMFGQPNYSFLENVSDETDISEEKVDNNSLDEMTFWYMVVLLIMLLTWLLVFFCLRIISLRQKTRTPAQRRMYVGPRTRRSFSHTEPTIYVSPSNLPPPPKYECLAPPSYEEVVGIHYPQYQAGQPITQPIAAALAQGSSDVSSVNVTVTEPTTVVTVTSERRTSNVNRTVQVATS